MNKPYSDQDTTPTPISVYFAWQKAIFKDETLRKHAGQGLKRKPADIRTTAFCVATYGMNGQHCHPSIETLMESTGFSRQTIISHLEDLVFLGWFTAVKKHRTSTDYSISIPLESNLVRPKDLESNSLESNPIPQKDALESNQVVPVESNLVRHHQDIDQEKHIDQESVTPVTLNQESRTSVRLDQENILESRPEAALDRQAEEVRGPWCAGCNTALISDDQDHDANCTHCGKEIIDPTFKEGKLYCPCGQLQEHEYICTSCWEEDKIETRSGKDGRLYYWCPSCGIYLVVDDDGVLTAKVRLADK